MSVTNAADENGLYNTGLDCRFLGLPYELRVVIYHNIFSNESVVCNDDSKRPERRLSALLSILFTNRTIHQEAKPIFYCEVTFHLRYGQLLNLQGPSWTQARTLFGHNRDGVRYVYYHGSDPKFVTSVDSLFPSLKMLEISLGDDFFHSDQTSFDRAMRNAMRYGEWKCAVKNALDERFGPGMRDAVVALRHKGLERSFKVTLHWSMSYRFVEFRGSVDLDEWILRIWDPDGKSRRIYSIKQDLLEPTWYEERLTLPCPPSPAVIV